MNVKLPAMCTDETGDLKYSEFAVGIERWRDRTETTSKESTNYFLKKRRLFKIMLAYTRFYIPKITEHENVKMSYKEKLHYERIRRMFVQLLNYLQTMQIKFAFLLEKDYDALVDNAPHGDCWDPDEYFREAVLQLKIEAKSQEEKKEFRIFYKILTFLQRFKTKHSLRPNSPIINQQNVSKRPCSLRSSGHKIDPRFDEPMHDPGYQSHRHGIHQQ